MEEFDQSNLNARLEAIEVLLKKVVKYVNPSLLPPDSDGGFTTFLSDDPVEIESFEELE